MRIDRELEEFRGAMEVPSRFEEGFNWSSLFAAIFIAMLIMPGAMYMSLLAGQGIGPAAQWVTVILFIEVARRAHRHLKRAEIFVLFFMSGAALSVPFSGLLWNQFFVASDAAREAGIAEYLPHWWAPPIESESYKDRTFFHIDWLPAIGLVIFGTFFSQLSNLILGYGLFRLTSDTEKLPFPLAPIGAQGVMALASDADEKDEESSWRWRVFSIGGAIGLAFGSIYLLLPTLTGALLDKPIMILPIPFSDFTPQTDAYLPAVATGMSWDLGNLLVGMVLPYFAMVGSFIGLIVTVVANPILHSAGILHSWTTGDDTVVTLYKNNVDFYFSFTIGLSLVIAGAGLWQVVRSLYHWREKRNTEQAVSMISEPPEGRGDIRFWTVFACYLVTTVIYILVAGWLIDWHRQVVYVMLFLGFVYTPLISYATARLEGIVGEVVEIPFIREATLIFSGYKGVAVWFIPMPMANYGMMTVFYRQCELTGTKFTSIWKSSIVLYPIILISSIFFANFIWGLAEVPSVVYPFADKMWELQARNQCIMYSATLGEYSIFEQAFDWKYLAAGGGFGVLLFGVMSGIGMPIFLIYGVVRGLGQSMPHVIIPQFLGALLGRYYFQRRLGLKWRQYAPVVAAGFACGAGLITIVGVAITFLSKAVIELPY
jgi:MFS family permease